MPVYFLIFLLHHLILQCLVQQIHRRFDFEYYLQANQLNLKPCGYNHKVTKKQLWDHYIQNNGKALTRFKLPNYRSQELSQRLATFPTDLSDCRLDLFNYRRSNNDLANLNSNQLLEHFYQYGQFEVRKYQFCCPKIITVNPHCPPIKEKKCQRSNCCCFR